MKVSIERKITIWFLLVSAIGMFFTYQTFKSRIDYDERGKWVRHSYDVQAEIQHINNYIQQMEIHSHHYLLTGRDECIKSYDLALDSLNKSVAHFSDLTKDNQRQQELLGILNRLSSRKIERNQASFSSQKMLGGLKALTKVAEGYNQNLVDSLKTVIDRMDNEEDTRLDERMLSQQHASHNAIMSLVIMVALFLLVIGIFYWLILSDIRKRKIAEIKLQENEAFLYSLTSELLEKNNELKKSEKALKELNLNKDKFFSILAHDMKSPFAGLLGMSQYLADYQDLIPKDEMKDIADGIYASSKKVYGLLTNLLEWSRLQMGKIVYLPSEVNLIEIADEIVELLLPNASAKNIYIKNNIEGGLCVFADQNMISTVIRNLVSNAIKFTGLGGEITLSAEVKDGYAEICVADTGIGMNDEVKNMIFRIDSKYSTKGTEGEEGTGLGLVLCRELVEKNHGIISVDSRPGKGTKFTFTLPLLEEEVIESR